MPVCAPALCTTPPVICPHTRACTLTPCTTTSHRLLPTPMRAPALHTTTLPSSAAHA
ncbi:hypothetical protein ID866_13126, partial [Astraeus odoratus]